MNAKNTHQIMRIATHLLEMTATFQSAYGKGYRVGPGDAKDTWALYYDICKAQTAIARLLDPQVLEEPHSLYGAWWEKSDVPALHLTHALVGQAGHLIAACAYADAQSPATGKHPHALLATQRVIAGMLQPAALLLAQDGLVEQNAS
jgi:hypothetical protein